MNIYPESEWEITASTGTITRENIRYEGYKLREGITKNVWGYGIKRLIIKDIKALCPMIFNVMSYKDTQNNWYIGIREQSGNISPIKYHTWDINECLINTITTLMTEHMK